MERIAYLRLLIMLASISTAAVSACAVGPEYAQPVANLPPAYSEETAGPVIGDVWWKQINDPVLERLIEMGLASNLDLAAAEARIAQARAAARLSNASLKPNATLNGTAIRQRISESQGNNQVAGQGLENPNSAYDLGLDVSWELDFAGGNKRGALASLADMDAAVADWAAARIRIASEIARAYVDLRLAEAQEQVNEKSISLQIQSLDLIEIKERFGEVSGLDSGQALARLETLQADAPGFTIARAGGLGQLAVLLGVSPGEAEHLISDGEIPSPSGIVSLGLPGDLLRNRPDLIAAERRLAASSERVGEEYSGYFPSFSFGGSIGAQSGDLVDLFSSDAVGWTIGPSLSWAVLDFGRIDAAVSRAKGAEAEALAGYRSAIVTALSEVETELARYRGYERETAQRLKSLLAERSVLETVNEQYRVGMIEFLQVLDAERNVTNAELSMVRARANAFIAYTSLMKALGGAV